MRERIVMRSTPLSRLTKRRDPWPVMDEILNYVSSYRRYGYHDRLYNFIQALSETARGQDNVVLVVPIPASELEYTADDASDEQRSPSDPGGDTTGSSVDNTVPQFAWAGEIPSGKWMNFYTRVITKFAGTPGLSLRLAVRVAPAEGVSRQKVEEARAALRDLGMDDHVDTG